MAYQDIRDMEIDNEIQAMFETILQRLDDLSLQIKGIGANRNIIDGEVMLNSTIVCQMLGITPRSLLRFRNRGLLHGIRVGRQLLYRRSEVLKLLNDSRKTQSPLNQK